MANYVDLVVHGDDRDLIPYLNGFLAGSGEPVRIVFAAEAGFHIRELRERIHYRGEVHHVVVEAAKAPLVRQALNAAAPRYRFKVEAEHAFERSRFQFEFDTPSRSVAGELKQTLTKLPPGLELSGYQPRETTDRARRLRRYTRGPRLSLCRPRRPTRWTLCGGRCARAAVYDRFREMRGN
jgi:hypothetical protein